MTARPRISTQAAGPIAGTEWSRVAPRRHPEGREGAKRKGVRYLSPPMYEKVTGVVHSQEEVRCVWVPIATAQLSSCVQAVVFNAGARGGGRGHA